MTSHPWSIWTGPAFHRSASEAYHQATDTAVDVCATCLLMTSQLNARRWLLRAATHLDQTRFTGPPEPYGPVRDARGRIIAPAQPQATRPPGPWDENR